MDHVRGRRDFVVGTAAAAGLAAFGLGCSDSVAERAESAEGAESTTSTSPDPTFPAAPSPRLNVLYVTVDDLGTTLGCYGHPEVVSPNIDAFAARSLLFERCYCQIAICSSSRSSILTSVRPERSGLISIDHDWQAALPDARSLPKHFRENGYQTASVGKIFDPRSGGDDDCWDLPGGKRKVGDSSAAIETLRTLSADARPFFLAVGFHQPHCPWEPTDEALSNYDPAGVQPLGDGRTISPGYQVDCYEAPEQLTEADARDITRRYFADVTDADRAFGEILATVDELGLAANTIIVFWSGDHGFHLGSNNRWGKWTDYDDATRVPLMISLPEMTTAGSRASGIVECVDMYPTLIELCGLSDPVHDLDGISMAPLLADPTRSWKHSAFTVFGNDTVASRSLKTPRYNLMQRLWSKGENPVRFKTPRYELYDLETDPDETTDLHRLRPELVDTLVERLTLGPDAALPSAPPIDLP